MTELLIRLFVKDGKNTDDPGVRGRYGRLAGGVGVACNAVLCAAKLVIGTLSGSVSITADAVNNLSDAASSVMTLLSFYIAGKPPDDEHPFGHARVEYLSGLGVAALIMVIGFQLGKSSVERLLSPAPVEFSWALAAVLALSIAVKLWLAAFNRSLGRRIGSGSLIAAAADSRNDVISTSAVLAGAVITRLTGYDMDGWIGLGVAGFILYSGFGIARDTIKPLLGAPADPELVAMVKTEVLAYDRRILGLHDLVVHDYGPGQRFATLHAEVDSKLPPLDAHELIDDIERMFMARHRIQLTIHYDPVITDDAEINAAHLMALAALETIDPTLSMHDFRMVRGEGHTNLIFDVAVPYSWAKPERQRELKRRLDEMIQARDPRFHTVVTFDAASFNRA